CVLLVATGGLLAWLLLGGRGGSGSNVVGPPVRTDDLVLVPANAQGFVSVRVGDVWDLPLSKAIRESMPPREAAELAEFEQKVGLTVADVERVTAVATDAENKVFWGVVALRKPYDAKKIKDLFPPGTVEVKQGSAVYHALPAKRGDDFAPAVH